MGPGIGDDMITRFQGALAGETQAVPPIWFMRQAGRYQRAYQAFRRRYSFEALCRNPEVAARVAMASIEDFDFDAAIVFSDLLFPLDALGIKVTYDDRGPHLAASLTPELLKRLRPVDKAAADLAFQAEAVAATRRLLPSNKSLIGFIGGPWTLFVYAVEGSHKGSLTGAKTSLDMYRRFARIMVPLLERAARRQLEAGADLVMVFDTAAGELTPSSFARYALPDLNALAQKLPGRLGYYARGLHPAHLGPAASMGTTAWAGQGFDWRWNISDVLTAPGRQGFVQGNFDPALLHLTGASLIRELDEFLKPLMALSPQQRQGWICGLGHGVLPETPEESVRTFVRTIRKRLA
jgi:uroporphyrinogen decarboxylase